MLDFIMDHLLTIVIVAVILFIVIPLIKSLLSKLILIAIVIAGLIFFGVLSSDVTETGTKFVENTIKPVVTREIKDADFDYKEDTKEYSVSTSSFHLKGKMNENTGEIRFRDTTYTMDVRFIRDFIEQKVQEEEGRN
ncbi:hypothetical protein [Bacillus alkalisoli]|uniref:hypothetical protein n=1 Tax=Bacillus alkalisoli TaxID=2011008 RepID=UPI000C23827A|nr:hypothetical protein [Bacillus alkalisoli]